MKFFSYLSLLTLCLSAHADLTITFVPSSPKLSAPANDYSAIWRADGDKITESMERISKVKFKETTIRAIIYEGISKSGKGDIPMRLRASYAPDTKKATLIHELGHRLLQEVPNTSETTEHKKLFLMLYDVWVDLYGNSFADDQVQIEKRRAGVYPEAWDWALALSKAERAAKLAELRSRKSF